MKMDRRLCFQAVSGLLKKLSPKYIVISDFFAEAVSGCAPVRLIFIFRFDFAPVCIMLSGENANKQIRIQVRIYWNAGN